MYRLVLTKEAALEIDRELAYSEEKWGRSHARRYARELRKKITSIRNNPRAHPVHDDILPGLRAVRYKGNQILYAVDESRSTVVILGVPSIHREFKFE